MSTEVPGYGKGAGKRMRSALQPNAVARQKALSVKIASFGRPGSAGGTVQVSYGTLARELLKKLGFHPEGVGLWWNGEPIPSDHPITSDGELEIVQTFSGG